MIREEDVFSLNASVLLAGNNGECYNKIKDFKDREKLAIMLTERLMGDSLMWKGQSYKEAEKLFKTVKKEVKKKRKDPMKMIQSVIRKSTQPKFAVFTTDPTNDESFNLLKRTFKLTEFLCREL